MAVAAAALLSPSLSHGGLVYDLRFDDGSSTKALTGAGTLTVELWGQVTGADTNHANDGLQTNYVVLQSQEINGGVFNGALTGGARDTFFSGSGSRNGTGSDLNGDGVGDWGSTDSDATNTDYMLARSDSMIFGGAGGGPFGLTVGQAVNANTWEFKVATWTLDVTSLIGSPPAGAETRIGIVQPNFTTGGGTPAYAVYAQDGVSPLNVDSVSNAGVYGDYVTLVVPEPTTLALVTLGGLALLSRRRRGR